MFLYLMYKTRLHLALDPNENFLRCVWLTSVKTMEAYHTSIQSHSAQYINCLPRVAN